MKHLPKFDLKQEGWQLISVSLFYSAFSAVMLYFERMSFLHLTIYNTYLEVKIAMIAVAVVIATSAFFGVKSFILLLVLGLTMNLDFCWSALFLPMYQVNYFVFIFALIFLCRRYTGLTYFHALAGGVGVSASYYYVLNVKKHPLHIQFADNAVQTIILMVVASLIFSMYIRIKLARINQTNILSILGTQSVRHLHDLKGLISVPMFLLETLKSDQRNERAEKAFEQLLQNFQKVRDLLAGFSKDIKDRAHLFIGGPKQMAKRASFADRLSYFSLSQFIVGVVFAIAFFAEVDYVPEPQRELFGALKLGGATISIVLSAWALNSPLSKKLLICSYVNMIFVCFISSIYRPGYQTGFFQIAMVAAFSFAHFPMSFLILNCLAAILSIVAPLVSVDLFYRSTEVIFEDRFFEIIIFTVLMLFVFHYFSRADKERENIRDEFGNIGDRAKNLSRHLQALLVDIRSSEIFLEKDNSVVKNLARDLDRSKDFARGLESLSLESRTREKFDLKSLLEDLSRFLNGHRPLFSLNIRLERNSFFASKAGLRTVFYNLIMNSIEASQENKHDGRDLKISVRQSGKDLIYEDNAGGMPDEILRKILLGQALTTKTYGSGLGLQIIRYELDTWGSHLAFESISEGLRIKFRAPPSGT